MLADKVRAAEVSQEPVYVEDVFSTWLYTGTGSTQTVTTNLDLSTDGGMLWIKNRSVSGSHLLFDTVRGADNLLQTNQTTAQVNSVGYMTTFNTTGFGLTGSVVSNASAENYVSWTFRKQPKFFDVVTYTGNGSNRTIAHNLGSVPGCIIVKRTDTSADWQVYHRSLANTEYLVLNSQNGKATGATRWNSTTPTSTEFSLGTDTTVNASGGTYVAYIYAHDAGGFGLSGADNVISCGGFTSVSGTQAITLGWEPQYLLYKGADVATGWSIIDSMRGAPTGSASRLLRANNNDLESPGPNITFTATGFELDVTQGYEWAYIAIRRGPMKVPTSGTQVFSPNTLNTVNPQAVTTNFPPDLVISKDGLANSGNIFAIDRLRGAAGGNNQMTLSTNSANADVVSSGRSNLCASSTGYVYESTVTGFLGWAFRRAPGFFDEVCYTGTGSARTVAHTLAAVPELMIVKKRSAADAWVVYANNDNTDYLVLNTTAATVDDNTIWNDTSPTTSVFTVGTNDDVNGNTATFVAYLFATLAGVSKVGSYTGTATTQTINCGFTAGARFVLIKRTDSTGDWYVWDTARGIVAGNDPYLLLNSTAAEVTSTDYIDTASSGFEISSTAPAAINASGGTFIFLAIA